MFPVNQMPGQANYLGMPTAEGGERHVAGGLKTFVTLASRFAAKALDTMLADEYRRLAGGGGLVEGTSLMGIAATDDHSLLLQPLIAQGDVRLARHGNVATFAAQNRPGLGIRC
jgi:hypothetical protein